jgi:hypothetical protein
VEGGGGSGLYVPVGVDVNVVSETGQIVVYKEIVSVVVVPWFKYVFVVYTVEVVNFVLCVLDLCVWDEYEDLAVVEHKRLWGEVGTAIEVVQLVDPDVDETK